MTAISKEKLINSQRFFNNGLLTKEKVEGAIQEALEKIDRNMNKLGERFPTPATKNNTYEPIDNIEWTTGFWTGMLWLAYEYSKDEKYRKLAEKQVVSFHHRIKENIEVEHHDLGFLYSLSCVSAYKITGMELAKEAALMAADKLITRYQVKGGFIQAWGELGAKDNYRLIVDCLLNIPLLYWASEVTGDEKYNKIADNHYKATIDYAIREDASAYHTFYFEPETGKPLMGKTRQGYSDDSSWARGQSWLIYGIGLNYFYHKKESDISVYEAVTNYFLNRLPKDFICYWDLIFDETSQQSRDSSATAIAVCGMNLMNQFLPETNEYKLTYTYAQHSMLASLIENYTESNGNGILPLINHGVYSWHSGKGVDEGNIWGDYYYLEALVRFYKDWEMYW
ncbi:glycoside hydrolase family 88 protein [Enterococcus songbeiensis]|uniref:glycoside hydrolase family 88 protein n=1 Tax=Enterococcus songbeiensis TaxID=2559927 RepID=UPI0010F9DBDA|nr:glycoside hydrolase family 88 protein [Enterococcus songbeiensis]